MKETLVPQPAAASAPPPARQPYRKPGTAATAPVQQIELVYAPSSFQEPLIVGVFGGPGTGKSRLIASAPSDVGLIATERKSKGTVINDAAKFGRRIVMPEKDMLRVGNPMLIDRLENTCIVIGDTNHKGWTPGQIQDKMQDIADTIRIDSPHPVCCKRHYYRWHVNRVKSVAYRFALEMDNIRAIGIDTFGTFVNDVSYANYGLSGVIDPKEFGFAPREDMIKEIRDFLNVVTVKHLILTHHSKDVWKDNRPTNKTQLDGKFSKLGHDVSVMLEHIRNDDVEYGAGKYVVSVRDCQANAELIGQDLMMDEGITFAKLFRAVYPEAEWQDFEDE